MLKHMEGLGPVIWHSQQSLTSWMWKKGALTSRLSRGLKVSDLVAQSYVGFPFTPRPVYSKVLKQLVSTIH